MIYPQQLVHNSLKKQALELIDTLPQKNTITTMRFIDSKLGFVGYILVLLIFPLLGITVLIATIASVLYMPICHP